jgi:predicted lipoprotein with Yx(FWY)xxD motif
MGALGLLIAGCGGASSGGENRDARAATVGSARVASSATDPVASSPVDAARAARSHAGVTVKVMRTAYGPVLVDGRGRALYLFTRDRTPSSRCYGPCARAWPPLLTAGVPVAGRGARADLLGRRGRSDGSTQVTYRGHPLYRYIGDRLPGQVLCQDVEEFGGRWYVVTRSGRAVR